MATDVRPATHDDASAISTVLARAFATNPFIRWLLPDDEHYARVGNDFFRLGVDRDLAQGEVFTNDARSGAALWLPPGSPSPSLGKQLVLGWKLFRAIGGSRLPRTAAAVTEFEKARPKQPHWYLTVLGTDPSFQGRGVGGALIDPILRRCDASGVAAYLESSNPANVPYYQRFGFEVTGQIDYQGGPTVPLMLRRPH
ncbi:MAG: GNAT family N-acetyltransferase [Myxococcota bacterium]